mgnify:CR=1 FL=1
MIWIIIGIFCALILLITLKPFRYWLKKGVPQSSLFQLWSDNIKIVFQLISPAECTLELHKRFGDERCVGTCHYFQPVLFLRDPQLIKEIAIKDFDYFIDHVQFVNPEIDPLFSKSLLLLRGDAWKAMRATLSPSFTSSKMKAMFELIKKCSTQFSAYYIQKEGVNEINAKDVFARFANDVIATCAFGVTCNSQSDPNNEFDAVPAYVRRNLDLFGNTMASVENYYSKYTVEKDDNNQIDGDPERGVEGGKDLPPRPRDYILHLQGQEDGKRHKEDQLNQEKVRPKLAQQKLNLSPHHFFSFPFPSFRYQIASVSFILSHCYRLSVLIFDY